ncbi:MAG: ATP-binding protein [Cyanobacteria bacterium J06633_2]
MPWHSFNLLLDGLMHLSKVNGAPATACGFNQECLSMNSAANVSLYEIALASEQPSNPLKISPSTFKSMVDSIMGVLTQHDLPATIWVKLPRGHAWRSALSQYCKVASSAPSIYILQTSSPTDTSQDSSIDDADDTESKSLITDLKSESNKMLVGSSMYRQSSISDDVETPTGYTRSIAMDSLESGLVGKVLQLSSDSRLKREYFVLAVAPNFRALALVHRPRSAKQLSVSTTTSKRKPKSSYATPPNTIIEDDSERRQPLLGICSFDDRTIYQVLTGIKTSIQLNSPSSDISFETQSVLSRWDEIGQQVADSSINPVLLGSFWSQYIQHVEDVSLASSSARKQAEAASTLQLENEELINSLRIKDEFLKTVGQELRTPLSTMKTAISLLGSSNIKPNQRQRYIDLLSQECDRQSALITSVLEFLQLENVDDQTSMQPLRVMDIVPGVVSTYQPLAQEKGVMLAYTISEDLPAVACLSNWMRQVVINLLHNGIKFTPDGGRVWVRARQQGEYVQLEFKDTGIGIASSELPKIFNRFYKVRGTSMDDQGGAGLGLSIVQQLLLKCGGSISVKSRPGEGSAFIVLLPIYQDDE